MYYSITNSQLASMDEWFVSYIEEMFGSPLEPELEMNFEKAAKVWVDKGLPEWILGRLKGSDAGNAASGILEKRNGRLFQR